MKKIALFLYLFSSSVYARQLFQCSLPEAEYTDVMVVNLQTPTSGTLFISSGMESDDERLLVKIAFDRQEGSFSIFKVTNEQGEGQVSIPSEVLNKNSDSVNLNLSFASYNFTYSCFSRIYND